MIHTAAVVTPATIIFDIMAKRALLSPFATSIREKKPAFWLRLVLLCRPLFSLWLVLVCVQVFDLHLALWHRSSGPLFGKSNLFDLSQKVRGKLADCGVGRPRIHTKGISGQADPEL